jgi:hypothetical protein
VRRSLRHPATAISLVALFISATGGAFAAGHALIPGSQIKPHSLPLSALTPGAIAALRGQRGPTGPQGPAGTNGTFDPSKVVRAIGDPVSVAPGQVMAATVACPPGAVAVGGGGSGGVARLTSLPLVAPGSSTPGGWAVIADNDSTVTVQAQATVVCASP